MSDALFTVTDGAASTEQLLYLNNMVISALKFAPDLVTLTRSIDTLASVIGIKVNITNVTLTRFAGGKVVKKQKQTTKSIKLSGYHKFRQLVKPLILHIFPEASIAEINKYASMIWGNVSDEVKNDWFAYCGSETDDPEEVQLANWITYFTGILNTLFEEGDHESDDSDHDDNESNSS